MLELPIHNRQGDVVGTHQFDESCLGKFVNYTLMHQAIVTYEANQRGGNASVKNRRSVTGHGAKPYRQKGTGRARMGHVRRVGSVGGAVAHGPQPRSYAKDMNRKARRAALKSALLGKFRDGEVLVVDEMTQTQPKTKEVAATLKALKINKSCLLVTKSNDDNLWKSARNIAGLEMLPLNELNTYRVLRQGRLLFTKEALDAIAEELN